MQICSMGPFKDLAMPLKEAERQLASRYITLFLVGWKRGLQEVSHLFLPLAGEAAFIKNGLLQIRGGSAVLLSTCFHPNKHGCNYSSQGFQVRNSSSMISGPPHSASGFLGRHTGMQNHTARKQVGLSCYGGKGQRVGLQLFWKPLIWNPGHGCGNCALEECMHPILGF